jgi:hypothetical protein
MDGGSGFLENGMVRHSYRRQVWTNHAKLSIGDCPQNAVANWFARRIGPLSRSNESPNQITIVLFPVDPLADRVLAESCANRYTVGEGEAAISQTWYFLLVDRPARQDFGEIVANLVIFSAILKATAFT